MKHKNWKWSMLLIVLILVGLSIDIAMTARLNGKLNTAALCVKKKFLPCAAIPTRYVIQEPECADKLLRTMNVTNVRILERQERIEESEEKIRKQAKSINRTIGW